MITGHLLEGIPETTSEIISLMENKSYVPEAPIHLCFLYLLSLIVPIFTVLLFLSDQNISTQNFRRGCLYFHHYNCNLLICTLCPIGNWDKDSCQAMVLRSLVVAEQLDVLRWQSPEVLSCALSACFVTKRSLAQFCASPRASAWWTYSPPPRSPA